MKETKIEVENLHKVYGKGVVAVHALKGVALVLENNQFVAIIGPSGSGKTTLLSCLGGILKPSKGKIRVDGNVEVALRIAGKNDSKSLRRAQELLKQMGLEEQAQYHPQELSGGEMQRVSIARALANDPKVILADEPTANLDTETGKRIIRLLEKLARLKNKVVIVVTHDERMIDQVDKVYYLTDGRLRL